MTKQALAEDPDFLYLAVDRKKLLKEQTQSFDGKKMCWVIDQKEGFTVAEILSTIGEQVVVKIVKNNEVSTPQFHFIYEYFIIEYAVCIHIAY